MSKNPTFDIYAKYYDLLYQDKEYDKEVNYLVGLINEYMPKANSILEFGSGTGIHGLLFKAKGYSVFGIELSQ